MYSFQINILRWDLNRWNSNYWRQPHYAFHEFHLKLKTHCYQQQLETHYYTFLLFSRVLIRKLYCSQHKLSPSLFSTILMVPLDNMCQLFCRYKKYYPKYLKKDDSEFVSKCHLNYMLLTFILKLCRYQFAKIFWNFHATATTMSCIS